MAHPNRFLLGATRDGDHASSHSSFAVHLIHRLIRNHRVREFLHAFDEVVDGAVRKAVAESWPARQEGIEVGGGVDVTIDDHVAPRVVGRHGRGRRRDGTRNVSGRNGKRSRRSAAGVGRDGLPLDREELVEEGGEHWIVVYESRSGTWADEV